MKEEKNRLELLQAILPDFVIYGEFVEAKPFGSGHINGTFVSTWNQAGTRVRYLHQRINEIVFHHPDEVMDNIQRVTSHIMKKLELAGVPDRSRRISQVVPARDGKPYVRDETGGWWRTYLFIEDVRFCEIAESPDQARMLGTAVGKFQKLLADLPGPRLYETIPHFHDMVLRYRRFDEVLAEDSCNRAAGAAAEIAFLNENRERGERISRKFVHSGASDDESSALRVVLHNMLPERICHNDTKINNILFNEELTEGICVTDL
ncbi:MAG: phosphotransferase, partial [Spirochaetaceae bacterium]|nr:phosphotransferase [Spirochaetaceae bacterium]